MKRTMKPLDINILAEKARIANEKAQKAAKAYEQAKTKMMAEQYERMQKVCDELKITFEEAIDIICAAKKSEVNTGDGKDNSTSKT